MKVQTKNIIISNAIPTNNGDAALVFGLADQLKRQGHNVIISTFGFSRINGIYANDYNFIKEFYDYNWLNKLKYINIFLYPFFFIFKSSFRNADLIISAPGGYINSYYGILKKVVPIIWAKCFGKKVVIYSQSIGPLNIRDKKILRFSMRFIDYVMVRDHFSHKYINEIIDDSMLHKVMRTEDAAFLLNPVTNYRKAVTEKIACISVRSWSHDERNKEAYYTMIATFTHKLIDKGYRVEFLSTCQGLNDYIDDSKVAKEIVNEYVAHAYKEKIKVNNDYYKLEELRGRLSSFDLVIGTRLHMCILSLIESIPTLNISYEVKGKECFSYLDLSDYSIDYNSDIDTAVISLNALINNRETLSEFISKKITELNIKSQEYLTNVLEK
ncbi:polysaccharide pyruvyl transferase family protein [Marivirga arenosa]|uniref:Polysaccharide pyruvyl transferase family protein n=1 Tax=Marivirga arenosa TaxID=3059076 RepID=A0AA49JAC5_9BACT|nr:polysaccharide pyruvyl transferase family protein [Marivirga sp. ABR2-2]WKK86012.1 polysaccharide pyruvyl transferase family protein [Marivirga sp. ABR2-2]